MNDPSVRPNAIWLPSASKAQLLIFWSTDIFEIASKLFMFQSLKIFFRSLLFTLIFKINTITQFVFEENVSFIP